MNTHLQIVSKGKCVASLCAMLVVLGILLMPSNGMAQNITMQDGGSSAIINPGNGSGNLGMNSWSVVGQNQLVQQWFWYSVGGGVAQPLNTLGTLSVSDNASGTEGLNDVTVTYDNGQLSANIEYVLNGNGVGSGSADLMEYIWIDNNSASSVTLRFYQYSNFNLLQNNNNNVSVSSDGSGGYNGALQTTGGPGGSGIAEVINAPSANRAEAAYVGQTLAELNGTPNLQLNDNQNAGPGDVTWAFQWNATLQPGDELDISKDKGLSIQMVPEPSTLTFIALGLGAWGLARRRQSS
ncbi:MAG: PEP-CTERM sorting domain-containing protein [Verrucomicrobiota bacterium]|jgi:hypothetical protein